MDWEETWRMKEEEEEGKRGRRRSGHKLIRDKSNPFWFGCPLGILLSPPNKKTPFSNEEVWIGRPTAASLVYSSSLIFPLLFLFLFLPIHSSHPF
jgi:hypothetical protein